MLTLDYTKVKTSNSGVRDQAAIIGSYDAFMILSPSDYEFEFQHVSKLDEEMSREMGTPIPLTKRVRNYDVPCAVELSTVIFSLIYEQSWWLNYTDWVLVSVIDLNDCSFDEF
jgi:hypothetical protein